MIELDKIVGFLPTNTFEIKQKREVLPYKHARIKFRKNGIWLTVSGKTVATKNSLTGITKENIKFLIRVLQNKLGLTVAESSFLNMQVYCVDLKKDVIVDYDDVSGLLSYMRELAYKNTTKQEILSYYNQYGFENSVLVKSTCKTIKDSLLIYDKKQEIFKNRKSDFDYFNNFSSDFFKTNQNILRFERRLQKAKNIRKAFHSQSIRLEDLLNSPYNVLGEKVCEVLGFNNKNG